MGGGTLGLVLVWMALYEGGAEAAELAPVESKLEHQAPADLSAPALAGAAVESILADRVPLALPPRTVPSTQPATAELRTLVTDLADDDIKWNATTAMAALRRIGAPAAPLLEEGLYSSDAQLRTYCELLLRGMDGPPTSALLEAVVDRLSSERPRDFSSAMKAVQPRVLYLEKHTRAALPYLYRGLRSEDASQRFLCAYLLACDGDTFTIAETCPLLIEHLADNQIAGDALMSAHALYRLGAPALPFVRGAMGQTSGQALSLLQLVELDITDPPRDESELRARRRLHNVTGVYYDPVIELDLGRSRVPVLSNR